MKKVLIISIAFMLSACSTMQPPRYAISVDNIEAIKAHAGAKARLTSLNQSASYQANCRLMGPIEPADGLSVSDFVAKAFNDEFKMAGIYSEDGLKIHGDITRVEFSSISGVTDGYWDLGIQLTSSNGTALKVNNKYSFRSGFDAITACNATADALTPAVQDLIKVTVNHPDFEELISAK